MFFWQLQTAKLKISEIPVKEIVHELVKCKIEQIVEQVKTGLTDCITPGEDKDKVLQDIKDACAIELVGCLEDGHHTKTLSDCTKGILKHKHVANLGYMYYLNVLQLDYDVFKTWQRLPYDLTTHWLTTWLPVNSDLSTNMLRLDYEYVTTWLPLRYDFTTSEYAR